jgi:hypothetical protein
LTCILIDHDNLIESTGKVLGEKFDQARDHPQLEVKGVTDCGLQVIRAGGVM